MNRFEIITADITTIKVQAVVNAANNIIEMIFALTLCNLSLLITV